ncbi:MAG: cytochrome c3 family protein [Thermodesulfobacteriota bacterium]
MKKCVSLSRGWLALAMGCGLAAGLLAPAGVAWALSGVCSDCHTMHNSQDGSPMATYGGGAGPNEFLTRGSCIGCHAQGGASKILTVGSGAQIPQVYHTDGSGNLAAGNFGYIDGTIGTGASGTKGHNVIDLFGANSDPAVSAAPGVILFHNLTDSNLRCAGGRGCHGVRKDVAGNYGLPAVRGAHHSNVEGALGTADALGNSYRFLLGVKGVENSTDRWQNKSAASHNEYFGATSPQTYGCGGGSEVTCHAAPDSRVIPPGNTMSSFCGSCHGQFHSLAASNGVTGIGTGTGSPFVRHPTDVILDRSGGTAEYAFYNGGGTTFSVEAPVARLTVPGAVSSAVVPSQSAVMCLSCHFAHGSDYPDMLRWEYNQNAHTNGAGNSNNGCFICHTTKDDA